MQPAMFRRGRRHEATAGLSSEGVDQQPFWLSRQGVEPDRVLVAPKVTRLRYDSPPWLINQELRKHHRERSHAASPLRGVSTQEVLEALGTAFSPPELDWELVGVTFVYQGLDPAPPVEVLVEAPPWAFEEVPAEAEEVLAEAEEVLAEAEAAAPARPSSPPKPRKWLPEHEEIMTAVRELSWEGYRMFIADIFRSDGYEVFDGEGPDKDVIDMEVVRGAERMLVNCQLRGLDQIGTEPLDEMLQVAARNGADGVFIISDCEFGPDAWALAEGQALVLVDRDTLLGLVLDFTLGAGREAKLKTQMRKLLSILQPGDRQWAS
ncbi:MAG: restriction endonuclease [Chloroflexi bacterium]|nr:MAG: restriction endonuclease [Chloroflexota bacterium]